MSWAMRRRILYALGVFLFFATIIGVPVFYKLSTVPANCSDGITNHGETAPDRGGPCALSDTSRLAPSSVLWTRSFKVRNGSYSATSYIQNPNDNAGVAQISYKFSLYDTQNILVAERTGSTYVMPGGITPVYEADIDTGNREVQRAFFQFTSPAIWQHYVDTSRAITISDRSLTGERTVPRLEARATNTDVRPRRDVTFVAVVFDTAGNAIVSSATHIEKLDASASQTIVFTWPNPFTLQVGRVDIVPVSAPRPAWTEE
jgi:hypothetical protein